jgi:antitoxin component of RelBE/YafQ-DinJ toxin-antitoxin module
MDFVIKLRDNGENFDIEFGDDANLAEFDILLRDNGVNFDLDFAKNVIARWLTNWNYRRFHQINPATGAGTGYQKKFVAKYDDNWENIRFATEGIALTPPSGYQFISGQTATYWDGQLLHIWYGASSDGTSDKDCLFYTNSGPPFTSWRTPVKVIDLTGSGIGIRDPTSYIFVGDTIFVYLFCQCYTTADSKTHPIREYYISTIADFTDPTAYNLVGDVVDLGAGGAFDDTMVASPCIMKSGATYYMVYEAEKSDGTYSIGLAHSADCQSWTKDGQLLDASNDPIVNPIVNTQAIVPCVFHDDTKLYVHIARAGGGKLTLRAITGDFAGNEVALETYELDPQIDGYWNHNALSETSVDAVGFRDRTVYLLGAWSTATYYLRVYIDYDCFSCNSNCQADFDDIRFTTGDGKTLLDYWLEQKTNSDYAIFWVEIPDNLDDMDDWWTNNSIGGVAILSADAVEKQHGNNSLKITFVDDDTHSMTLYHDYDDDQDFSGYDYISFWWYGANTGQNMYIDFINEDYATYNDGYTYTFIDDFTGWHHFHILRADFDDFGAPTGWNHIRCVTFGNSDVEQSAVWRFDYLTVDDGVDYTTIWDDIEVTVANMYCYYGNTTASSISDPAESSLWNLGDDFKDNLRDAKWTEGEYHSDGAGLGTVDEVSNHLEISTLKSGDEAWYVSTDVVDASGCVIRLRTTNAQNLGQMGLWIIPTQYTNVDLWSQLEWYRVLVYGDGNIYIQSKTAGTLYTATFLAQTDIVIIKIIDGHIYFYEQDATYPWLVYLRADETYTLSDTDVFVYLEGRCDNGAKLGPEYHDDFFSRKMIATEPAHGEWGDEEETNSYAIDVILKRLGITKTYSADVILKRLGVTKDYLIDAVLKRLGIETSYDIDVILQQLATKEKDYDIDVIIELNDITKDYDVDVLIKKLGLTKAYLIDTLIQKTIEKNYSLDTIFLKSISEAYSLDVLFKKLGIEKTYSIDVLLEKLDITKFYSIDVLFQKLGIEKSYDVDTILSRLGIAKSYSIDVMLQKVGLTETYSIDALFQKLGIELSYSIDAILERLDIEKPYSIDTIIERLGIEKTYSIDVLLQKLGIEKSYSVDTLIQKLGIEKDYDIDVILSRLGITKAYSIDIMLQKMNLEKTYSVDVLFQKLGIESNYSIDTILKRLDIEKPYGIDTVIERLGITKPYSIDSIFERLGITKDYSIDVSFFGTSSKNYNLDTLFKKLDIPLSYLVDCAIASFKTKSYSIDALFFTTVDKPYSLDVVFILKQEKAYSIDVLFQKLGIEKAYLVDAVFQKLDKALPYAIDVSLQKLGIQVPYSIDVLFKKLGIPKTYNIDVILSALLGTELPYSIDTILKRTGLTETYLIDAVFSILPFTASYAIDTIFKRYGETRGYSIDVVLTAVGLPVPAYLTRLRTPPVFTFLTELPIIGDISLKDVKAEIPVYGDIAKTFRTTISILGDISEQINFAIQIKGDILVEETFNLAITVIGDLLAEFDVEIEASGDFSEKEKKRRNRLQKIKDALDTLERLGRI